MEQMQTAAQRVSSGLVNLGTKLASTALSFSTLAAMVGKVVETAKDELELVKGLVLNAMELNQPLKVPLLVDINTGESWKES